MKISQPPEKIVKNLCTFLCQDVDETPAFALVMQHEKGFITVKSILSSDSNSANGKGANAKGQDASTERAIRRRFPGEVLSLRSSSYLESLARIFSSLYRKFGSLWLVVFSVLLLLVRLLARTRTYLLR